MRSPRHLGLRHLGLRHLGLPLVLAFLSLGACTTRGIGAENENANQNWNENQNQNWNENQNNNSNQNSTTLEILLTVYGSSGEVVQEMTVQDMGPVTIAPPADEPDPPSMGYVVMAQARDYYTELFHCTYDQVIDVQLDAVPALPQALTGVVIRTSYFSPPTYLAQGTLLVTDPAAGTMTQTTDAQGRYRIANGALGTWKIEVQCGPWEEPLPSVFELPNGAGTDYQDLFVNIDMSADAPNVYLYPTETTAVSVTLGFPLGGEVTLSDPPYDEGWHVTVAPDGTIDNAFPYLFYEARLPYRVQRERGWVLAAADLEAGFTRLLQAYGYAGREVTDFLEYWLPLMTTAPWYGVYPLPADELVTLSISPAPAHLRRLWLFLEPLAAPLSVDPPATPPPLPRDGFTAWEWGAFLSR